MQGQVTVEYILLTVALIFMFQFMAGILKNNQALSKFQSIQYNIFKNMVENGNWIINPKQSFAKHPNQHDKHHVPDAR